MKKEDIPIIRSLKETLQGVIDSGFKLPDLSKSETIFCFSDYAGDRKSDGSNVYSFLFYDYKQSGKFKFLTEELRDKESDWRHHSFIEYKKIPHDAIRARILPEFLEIVDALLGVLIVVYIDKDIESLFESKGREEFSKLLEEEGFGKWKADIAEKLCQVLLFQSFFASELVTNNQKYFWYSDRDAINDEGRARFDFVGKLLGRFFDILEISPSFVGYATNLEKDGPDNYFGDILCIPDLVAGATLEYFEDYFGEDKVKFTTNEILQWFSRPSTTLQKIHLRLRKEGQNLRFSNIVYNLKNI